MEKITSRNRIYTQIYNRREISRQELSQELNLSLPTVNQGLKELTEKNLIGFVGNFESTGGRKAQVISVKENAKAAVTITISKYYIKSAVINLMGDIIYAALIREEFQPEKEYAGWIADMVNSAIENSKIAPEDILGVGLIIPGVFDRNDEIILSAPILQLRNYPVKKFTEYIPYRCRIMNDAKSGALAHMWKNADENPHIYLMIDKGVGGSIVCGRKMNLMGIHKRAGEFGHMTLYPGGRKCSCGKRGCVEAYLSVGRLSDDLGITVEEFFTDVEKGNYEYRELLEEYIRDLCIAVNNIYMVFDCDITVGGTLSLYLLKYRDMIRKELEKLSSFDTDGMYLSISHSDENSVAAGAGITFIEEFIKSI